MRYLRRLLQAVALVGTIMVGVVALALIVSQTPWFKDWLRRYIVRESKQYLNGELSIGGLGGNLLFGVDLTDLAVDVSGERVVAAKALQLDYSVFEIVSKGIVLNQIALDRPVLRLEHDASGWNLSNLVKKQRQEADRRGPMRPISLPSILVSDGTLAIRDAVGTSGVDVPETVGDLDIKAGFEYAPVHYSLTLDHVSFRGAKPDVAVRQLTGKLAVRDDNLYADQIVLKTAESSVTIDGVVERYLSERVLKITTTGTVSMPEVGRILTAARGYDLEPDFTIKASGPASRVALELQARSAAGRVAGQLVADVEAPDFAARGSVDVERLNLAPLLKDPAQRTDLTGHAVVDLKLASRPAPAVERLTGTFAFEGPRVAAAGYEARQVKVKGSLAGARVRLDGRAAAYGGTGTARGILVLPVRGRRFGFELQGTADHLNLRNLPATVGAPQLTSDFSVAEYHVRGDGAVVEGSATLRTSIVEGATLAAGTTGEFTVTAASVAYGARGSVSGLDVRRVGRGLKVAALDKPLYDGRVNGSFDVKGSVSRVQRPAGRRAAADASAPSVARTMTLDASGTLTETRIAGGLLPDLRFEAQLQDGALKGHAKGRFENFNPGAVSGRSSLDGQVSGTVDASVTVADVTAPVTHESVSADGTVTLARSTIGGLEIERAEVAGRYASQRGDITRLQLTGPDLAVEASGHVALDRAGASNVTYHVEAVNLADLAKLAGQPGVGGSAILDGTMTGNAASLGFSGTLDGSDLSYDANNALDLNSRYTVTIPELAIADARIEATTSATFVKAAGLEIDALEATTTYAGKELEFTTTIKDKTRELDASGRVVFHPDHQEIHLPGLALRTEGVEWKMAPDANATVKYGQNRVELQHVKLASGAQTLDLSGTFALDAETPAGALEAHARNVDVQQLETLLMQNRGLTGTLNADATISGSKAAPKIEGQATITNGGFKDYRYDSLVAKVTYAGTRVGVDATLQQSATESLTARGTVPTTAFEADRQAGHVEPSAADEIDLQVKSSPISLAFVQGLTTQVTNVSGTLEADVHLGGSARDPHVTGFVDVKNGAFAVPAVGETYSGLTTRIDLEPDLVKIRAFEILDRHQERLRVSGELAVHERAIGGVNISLDSDNFELVRNELGDVQVQSALKITGELRRPRVEGEVRFDAGRIEVDKVLAFTYDPYAEQAIPDVVSAERTAEKSGSAEEATKDALARAQRSTAAPVEEAPLSTGGVFDALALNVHVVIPDNLVLRGNDIRPGGPTGAALGDMNITLGGDLYVRKEPGGPVAPVGTVTTVRGTYHFQGRRFDLVRDGTLRFTGEGQINPLLDVTAKRVIPNTGVEARIRVTGTARAPQLQLSSTPPLEQSDILALIVFNRPVNELGTGERSSLAATAGGIATGFIAAPLGESIGKALDLDLFEISTTTDNGEFGAGLTLGQQVGDKAFLKLRQQFGARSATEFLVEYNLTRFLRVEASAAPETTGSANRINQTRVERAGVNLIFFFSY